MISNCSTPNRVREGVGLFSGFSVMQDGISLRFYWFLQAKISLFFVYYDGITVDIAQLRYFTKRRECQKRSQFLRQIQKSQVAVRAQIETPIPLYNGIDTGSVPITTSGGLASR